MKGWLKMWMQKVQMVFAAVAQEVYKVNLVEHGLFEPEAHKEIQFRILEKLVTTPKTVEFFFFHFFASF